MDGNTQAEPCTRKLAWFRSATCMDGLAQVHGWTFRSAWFRFRRCMDGLKKPDFGPINHACQPPHEHPSTTPARSVSPSHPSTRPTSPTFWRRCGLYNTFRHSHVGFPTNSCFSVFDGIIMSSGKGDAYQETNRIPSRASALPDQGQTADWETTRRLRQGRIGLWPCSLRYA